MMASVHLIFTLLVACVAGKELAFVADINGGRIRGLLPHFWESTGFCPPAPHVEQSLDYDLGESMHQNLLFIAGIPNRGSWQVRIHFLLDLVTATRSDAGPLCNFTQLDVLVARLVALRLRPGFELMGNPSGLFTDFDDFQQAYMWRSVVQLLAQHYVDLYGIDEVPPLVTNF